MAKTWVLSISVTLCLILITARLGESSCIYPDFVQNDPTNILDFWGRHVEYGVPQQKFVVANDTVSVTIIPNQEPYAIATCNKQIGNVSDAKFINKVTIQNLTLYMCTQIIKRTPDLLQIKFGPMGMKSIDSLCDDANMKLHGNLAQAMIRRDLSWHFCGFNGGYVFEAESGIWNSTSKPLCPQLKGQIPSRVEGECLKGEGIQLTFPLPGCIPDKTGWSQFQSLSCKGSWTDGKSSFSVLASTGETYCMKYPANYKDRSGNFTAYIYQYLTCPAGDPEPGTPYIKLTMTQLNTKTCQDDASSSFCLSARLAGLCQDDISVTGLFCRKTCLLCSSTMPPTKTFDKTLQGNWVEVSSDQNRRNVSITSSTYTDAEFGTFVANDMLDTTTYVLKTTPSDIGCLPRYLCSTFQRKSPPVLSYKFSRSVLAYQNKYETCLPARFQDDALPLGDTYRSMYMKNLISRDPNLLKQRTVCGFGGNFTTNVTIPSSPLFPDNTECSGVLSDNQNCVNLTQMYTAIYCSVDPLIIAFDCLATWDSGYHSTRKFRYVLTISTVDRTLATCWVIPEGSKMMYTVGSGQCNEATLLRILAGRIQPYSIISAQKRPDPCTGSTPSPMTTSNSSVTTSNSSVTTSSIITGSATTSNNTVHTTPKPHSGPNSGEVAGIVIGCLIGVTLLAGIVLFLIRRRIQARKPYETMT